MYEHTARVRPVWLAEEALRVRAPYDLDVRGPAWVGGLEVERVWNAFREHAPGLLKDGGYSGLEGFRARMSAEPTYVVWYDGMLVLVTNWYARTRAACHPVIWNWRAVRRVLPEIAADLLRRLHVFRLEFPLRSPSVTLRRALETAGARREGTARNYETRYDHGQLVLSDVDIWSIVPSEAHDGCD